MYKYLGKLKINKKKQTNCMRECEKCYMCQKETRGFSDCWESCDACNRCNAEISKPIPDPLMEISQIPLHPWFQLSWFQLY